VTDVLSARLDTRFLAFTFGIESILVATTTSVPETTATSVFGVEEVFDCVVVAACSHVSLEAASLLWGFGNLFFASLEVFAFSFADTIWAAAVLACSTSASFKVRSTRWCLVVRAALEFAVAAVAALVVWASGSCDSIWTASELISVAWAALVVFARCCGNFVWAAAMW
jgi:hypothetical protein